MNATTGDLWTMVAHNRFEIKSFRSRTAMRPPGRSEPCRALDRPPRHRPPHLRPEEYEDGHQLQPTEPHRDYEDSFADGVQGRNARHRAKVSKPGPMMANRSPTEDC